MTSFITTPIFYASGDPHLGHAYSGIIADVYHRFQQLSDNKSVLITGTDEHGQKIAATATAHNTDVTAFVDAKAAAFNRLWPELGICPSTVIRTTQPQHKAHIRKVWQRLIDKGDIYLGTYSGEYCVACEQYYPSRELENNQCPVHKKPVETVTEETYLFRLESYRQPLLKYYQQHPELITSGYFQNSIIELLKEGPLKDLSVSRVNNRWGTTVPNDDGHTIYVWIDALFSYITAIQLAGGTSQDIAETTHVLGKDILKFHALYWPVFLLALDLPLPKKLVVHGWWTIEGEKISKSNPKTTVNPKDFSKQLTSDGLRYALVRQKPLSRDGNVAIEELKEVVNADLANNLANLVKRNNTLVLKHFSGGLAESTKEQLDNECRQLLVSCNHQLDKVILYYQQYELYQVARVLKQVLDQLNAFFHHRSPWLINKGQDRQQVENTCFIVGNILRQVVLCYSPITPQLAISILSEQGIDLSKVVLRETIDVGEYSISGAKSHFNRIKIE